MGGREEQRDEAITREKEKWSERKGFEWELGVPGHYSKVEFDEGV